MTFWICCPLDQNFILYEKEFKIIKSVSAYVSKSLHLQQINASGVFIFEQQQEQQQQSSLSLLMELSLFHHWVNSLLWTVDWDLPTNSDERWANPKKYLIPCNKHVSKTKEWKKFKISKRTTKKDLI